jgi:acyl-CoA synthetase (AMP-forming)/AMP-acid ligase II
MTLVDLLREQAARPALRDATLLLCEGRSYTYRDIEARVGRAAAVLAAHGIGRGDVVSPMLGNCPEMVIALFAAARLGALFCPINPAFVAEEVGRQLADSRARCVIAGAEHLDTVEVARRVAPGLRAVLPADALTSATEAPIPGPAPCAPDDVAWLIYTSGSTGSPKGVLLTHRSVLANAEQVRERTTIRAGDRVLHAMPLHHVNGLGNITVMPVLAGATIVLARRFRPEEFWPLVPRHRPRYFTGVPTMLARLLAALPDERPDLASLEFVRTGAAPLPESLRIRWEARVGVPIVVSYGLTELTCTTAMNPVNGERRAGSVGPPLRGHEIRVLDPTGRPLGPGRTGEVVVRSQTLMQGYLGRPAETAAALRDGWLYTGDLGYLDAGGYLYLTDRKKEVIIRGGENISPREIEEVLHAHAEVAEAAVVGLPDAEYGEIVAAFVVPRPGARLAAEAVQAHCAKHLARFKVPAVVHLAPLLPRNSVGKLDRPALGRMAASRPGPPGERGG